MNTTAAATSSSSSAAATHLGGGGVCQLSSRPNLVAFIIHTLSYFGAGVVMSSWAWNQATRKAWTRFFRK